MEKKRFSEADELALLKEDFKKLERRGARLLAHMIAARNATGHSLSLEMGRNRNYLTQALSGGKSLSTLILICEEIQQHTRKKNGRGAHK